MFTKPKPSNLDDQELLRRFMHDGDNEWLGILLNRYSLLMYGVCLKYLKEEEEAKDAVQQICIRVLDELKKYPVTYFKSWLYQVARTHCLMKLRSKPVHFQDIQDDTMLATDPETDTELLMQKETSLEHLQIALKQLNPDQQLCITLFYLEKKSYQEVSELSGLSMLQVKSHLQNGKRNLKLIIQKLQNNG